MEKLTTLIIICILSCVESYPSSNEKLQVVNDNQNSKLNQSLDDLVLQQTEAIKKIVSDQQNFMEHPIITKDEVEEKQKLKEQLVESSNEELKVKCQHLQKLLNLSNPQLDQLQAPSQTNAFAHKMAVARPNPVFLHDLNGNPSVTRTNGFYVTTDQSIRRTTTQPPKKLGENVRYIRLEPVILQKTFLSDGKIVYYWHKSLPSAVHYVSNNPVGTPTKRLSNLNEHNEAHSASRLQQLPENDQQPDTSEYASSTTTTGYSFKNFFPSFYSSGYEDAHQPPKATTTTTTTTTTSTTARPSSIKPDEFSTQLRFVVPVPYGNMNITRQPWDFDQFAYYPKQLQPSTVNVQVPYTPTFHVIKALAVPNEYLVDTSTPVNKNYGKGYYTY